MRGRGIWREDGGKAYLVELVAEVYGVDVIALEVGEHDDLLSSSRARKTSSRRLTTVSSEMGMSQERRGGVNGG